MIADETALEDLLSRPDDALRADLAAAPVTFWCWVPPARRALPCAG